MGDAETAHIHDVPLLCADDRSVGLDADDFSAVEGLDGVAEDFGVAAAVWLQSTTTGLRIQRTPG